MRNFGPGRPTVLHFSPSRTTVLTVLTVVEVLILLFFIARWYNRKWGWQHTFSRVGDYLRDTVVDLVRPALQFYRFSRGLRLIAAELADPYLAVRLESATDSAALGLAGTPDHWPYAASMTSRSISLAVAGPFPVAPAGPWQDRGGWWVVASRSEPSHGHGSASNDDSARHPADRPSPPSCPVVIGADRNRALLIFLERTPGVLEVSGAARPVFSLICGISVQLLTGLGGSGEGVEVLICDGVHPKFDGPPVHQILDELNRRVEENQPADTTTILVCGRLEAGAADMIAHLCRHLPTLRVITAGPYPGSCWRLPLSPTGRIEAPELGLVTDSTPLERGVARALRLRANASARPPVGDAPPMPNLPVPPAAAISPTMFATSPAPTSAATTSPVQKGKSRRVRRASPAAPTDPNPLVTSTPPTTTGTANPGNTYAHTSISTLDLDEPEPADPDVVGHSSVGSRSSNQG